MGVNSESRFKRKSMRDFHARSAECAERAFITQINALEHDADPRRFRRDPFLFAWTKVAPACPRDEAVFLTTFGPSNEDGSHNPNAWRQMNDNTSLIFRDLRHVRRACALKLIGRHDVASPDGGWIVWEWVSEDPCALARIS